jgi:chromosome segregation ATPase
MLEQVDRARRAAEQELQDSQESLSDLTAQNQSLVTAKRRVEAEMDALKQEVDDVSSEGRSSEDKAHRTMMDAAKLADELRMEQDHTNRLESERKVAENHVRELQSRLDEAEANALKNGKKAATKLDAKIRELEAELDAEQRRLGDASKNFRRAERRIKELDFQYEEDRKQHEHMQDLVDKLQQKVSSST